MSSLMPTPLKIHEASHQTIPLNGKSSSLLRTKQGLGNHSTDSTDLPVLHLPQGTAAVTWTCALLKVVRRR